MRPNFKWTSAFGLVLCACVSAHAASGQIHSFGASALLVQVGTTVDFVVSFSVVPDSWPSTGGSDLVEPAQQDGQQTWLLNWYSSQTESVASISLQAEGQSFTDMPALPPGSTYSGSWSFSSTFATPGQHQVTVAGDWSVRVDSESGQEIATRNCIEVGDQGVSSLWCDAWSYQYPQFSDTSTTGAQFSPATLQIEVLAAVPEPSTVAVWLLGLVGLTAGSRLSRRQAARATP